MYAQIVFPKGLNKALTYLVPDHLRKDMKVGQRVLAPLEKRELLGFVVSLSTEKTFLNLKPILSILDKEPVFSKGVLSLCGWVSEYYFSSLGECLQACLPPQLCTQTQLWIRLSPTFDEKGTEKLSLEEKRIVELLKDRGELRVLSLKRKIKKEKIENLLKNLQGEKILQLFYRLPEIRTKIKADKFYSLKKPQGSEDTDKYYQKKVTILERKAPKQASFFRMLLKRGEVSPKEFLSISKSPHRILKSMEEKDLVGVVLKKKDKETFQHSGLSRNLPLSSSQKKVCEEIKNAIDQGVHGVFLLFGDSSSERERVYLEAIRMVSKKDKSALVLVPEISQMPKTQKFFESSLGEKVACLHSKLSSAERFREWERIKKGEMKVVVGTRSSVFAPLSNLGVIVVDEEQDPSFKQEDQNPRYHARDVAVMRTKIESCVTILGSATPSMESFFNAQKKKYTLLQLQPDESRSFLQVRIVDMRKERRKGNLGCFSEKLKKLLADNFKRNRKALLFLNRRGYSKVVKCQDCGYVFKCPSCNISLTYHLAFGSFKCHFCGYVESPRSLCPACKSFKLSYKGFGIEKIEEEIKEYHPQILLGRMDSDSVGGSPLKISSFFNHKKYNLILGTQMIKKDFDFPDVGLVGVVSADFGLDFPDFRAREKTFQLLSQIIEKAKREGDVVIQTYYPSDPAIMSACSKNFSNFFSKEITLREELGYPPFTHLVSIKFSGVDLSEVKKISDSFGKALKKKFRSEKIEEKRILGPAPAFRFRLKGKYNYQILLKAKPLKKVLRLVKSCFGDKSFKRKKSVRISVNVDPLEVA